MRQDVQVRERAAGILGSWEQLSWHSHVYGEVSGGGFFFCFSSVFPFFLLRRKKKGEKESSSAIFIPFPNPSIS